MCNILRKKFGNEVDGENPFGADSNPSCGKGLVTDTCGKVGELTGWVGD